MHKRQLRSSKETKKENSKEKKAKMTKQQNGRKEISVKRNNETTDERGR